jgi:probable phosphoglycerate mutase
VCCGNKGIQERKRTSKSGNLFCAGAQYVKKSREEQPMRIIFVRHGHPNYVNDCLTELGRKHAAAAAERLKDEGISEIYSSTNGRALETAGYVAEKYGLPVVKCEFMREISWGSVDNEPLFLDGHPWSTVDAMVAKGESILNPNWAKEEPFVRNKMVGYTENIATALDEWLKNLGYTREGLYYRVAGKNAVNVDGNRINTVKTIAAFGHGGAGSAIFSHLFNLPYPFVCTTLNQDYTGITIVELPDTPGALVKPRFEIMNDARHIKDLRIENIYEN